MKMFQRAIVAVGDVERDAELLRYARLLRTISPGIECCFVHVLNWALKSRSAEPPPTHKQALERLAAAVGRHFGSESADCRVLTGDLVDRLLETIAESAADVVLVGHGSGHSGRRALARRLSMQAPCCVWMRPEGSATQVRRVIAATDYSEPSAYALSLAASIAARSGSSECLALHVYFNPTLDGSSEIQAAVRAGEREAFESFSAPLDTSGITVRPLFEEGPNVAHAVERVAAATSADLVVMGSRGQSRSASILLGSESDHMLMESKMPVLIAKRRGERIGLLQALLDRDFHLEDPPRFG